MYQIFKGFALAACLVVLSFSARADAPDGWKEDEKFLLIGREAYQSEDKGLAALVDRVPAPFGFEKPWFKKYVEKELSKYKVQTLKGPFPLGDDPNNPVEGAYFIFTASKNDEGKLVLITYGVLIGEEAQVWKIFWNNSNAEKNTKLVLNALNFMAAGGSKDGAPEAKGDLDKFITALGKDSKKTAPAKSKAEAPPTKMEAFVAAPGEGVQNDALRGVVYDFGKRKMKKVWVNDMMMRIPTWSGTAVYVVFQDGWAYRGPSVPPADLNVAESRRVEPKKWVRWDDVKLNAPTGIMPPLEKGTRINISVQRPNTTSSSRTSVRTSWSGLKLTSGGRFETDRTSISSRQTGIDSTMGPSSNTVSSSGKDGTFSSVSSGFVAGGGMIQTQGTKRQSGSKGNHTGTYFIDGNTIELRYDDGAITRAVFGFDGEDGIIFGRTNYWR